MAWHIVEPGECVSSLAQRYGLVPRQIWDDDANKDLRQQRGDGNVLLAGDRLFIPERAPKSVERPTGALHRFRRRGVPAKFTTRLVDDGAPKVDRPFVVEVAGKTIRGRTDGTGKVEAWIPPAARELDLTVGEGEGAARYHVLLGELDPVDTLRGAQARLANLGFDCPVDGADGEETREAIEDFQEYFGHPAPSGELDEPTREALAKLHDENRG
jgi:N-acetylmuramoyl-L-alanine amidase